MKISDHGVESVQPVSDVAVAHLCDAVGGQAVWRTEHAVYVGKTLLAHSEQRVGLVRADGEYIAVTLWSVQGDELLVVYDRQGKTVGEWTVPPTGMLMDISSKRGCVYVGDRTPCEIRAHAIRQGGRVLVEWRIPRFEL
jgi:hypothetical protein